MGNRIMSNSGTERALTRVLLALEREILEASDAEIEQAAAELGMNLQMRESSAYRGLTFPAKPQPGDFFEIERHAKLKKIPPGEE